SVTWPISRGALQAAAAVKSRTRYSRSACRNEVERTYRNSATVKRGSPRISGTGLTEPARRSAVRVNSGLPLLKMIFAGLAADRLSEQTAPQSTCLSDGRGFQKASDGCRTARK